MLRRSSVLAGAVLALLGAGDVPAQVITGTVHDGTGAVVSGARVMLMQRDYVKLAETNSGEKGEFLFADLKPGLYFVQIKRPMFQLFQQHVDLKPGEKVRIYPVLTVARGLEEFTIIEDRPAGAPTSDAAVAMVRAGGKVEGFRRISGSPPGYPAAAINRGASGTVALFATVKTDGTLADITPLGAADPDLEKASIDALSKWRYQPMKLDGVAVKTHTVVLFNFRFR